MANAEIACFFDEFYVQRYCSSAMNRLIYTKAMGIDICVELEHWGRTGIERILDIGCGAGDLLIALSKEFPDAELTGLDISEVMLLHAERLSQENGLTRVTWKQGSIEELNEPDASFDLIVSQYSFDYWKQPMAMTNILRMLKPDGLCFLRNLNAAISDEYLDAFMEATVEDPDERDDFRRGVRNAYTPDRCKALLSELGLCQFDVFFMHRNARFNQPENSDNIVNKMINYNVSIRNQEVEG